MLAFATDFPVVRTSANDDFLQAVGSWILQSPHTSFVNDDLQPLLSLKDFVHEKNNERVEMLRFDSRSESGSAIRHLRHDQGLDWTINIVFNQNTSESWIGIQLFCESRHPSARLPPAKKPYIVKTLLGTLGGGDDGILAVQDTPHILSDLEIDVAARLISGDAKIRLPIVYISCGFDGSYLVDANNLARQLSGMAHVVLEPNRPFSNRLKIEVRGENVYGGTVGVYWPDGGGRRSYFLGERYDSPIEITPAITEEVRTALANRRPLEHCTWSHVLEISSHQAIEELKASGSREVDKYIATFDKELRAKQDRLEAAEKEIRRLQSELQIYEAQSSSRGASLLNGGTEHDFFPNEIFAITRDALSYARQHVPDDSRRQHVLDALLDANPARSDLASAKKEQLKQLLRGKKKIDSKTRRQLESLGFAISEDGKHHKLVYQGDERYVFPLPKSGSDHRGGLNAASDIGRMLF